MATKLFVWLGMAVVAAGCSAVGPASEEATCRDALSGGGVPLKVCQNGGALTVYAPSGGGVSAAAATAAAQSNIDIAALPVAEGAFLPSIEQASVSDCWASRREGRTTIHCALALELSQAAPPD